LHYLSFFKRLIITAKQKGRTIIVPSNNIGIHSGEKIQTHPQCKTPSTFNTIKVAHITINMLSFFDVFFTL